MRLNMLALSLAIALGGCATNVEVNTAQDEARDILKRYVARLPSNTMTDIGNARLQGTDMPMPTKMKITKDIDGTVLIVPDI